MITRKEYRIKDWMISILIFIIFFFGYLVRSRYELTLWDEGYNAYTAERVYDGQVPYRDFHVIYAPGRFFVQALMFRIFGVNLAVERAYMVILIALFALITYFIARQLKINRGLSLWLTILVSHNSTSIFITPGIDRILGSFAAVLGMIVYDKTGKKIWLALTGFLCAMNILIGQETGAYTLAALVVFLCLRAVILSRKELKEKVLILIRDSGIFAFGVFTGIIPFLIYMNFHGAVTDTMRDLLINPLISYTPHRLYFSYISTFKAFFDTMHLRIFIYLNRFLLAVIIPAGTLVFIFAKKVFYKTKITMEDRYLLMLALFGVFFGVSLLSVHISHHILMALPPTYIISMLFFERGWRYLKSSKSYTHKIISFIFIAYLGAHFLTTTASTVNSYTGPFRRPCWKLELPRAKILNPSHNKIGPDQRAFPFRNENEIKELIGRIRTVTPGSEPIFIVSQDAMLYFLADRDNPTGYDLINNYYMDIRHQKNMIKDLESKKVKYVVLSNVPYSDKHTCKDEIKIIVPQLYNYIIDNYRFENEIGLYEFWKRK
jgi:hypothetical protein